MTDTAFGTNDPRTQKIWSRKSFEWAMNNMFFAANGFVGEDSNSILQINKELAKSAGDKITFELMAPLTGTGQGDDGNTENAAEALSLLNFSVEIHERAHRVGSAGKMSEKRTSTQIRTAARDALGTWMAEKKENDIVAAMSGTYNEAGIATVNEYAPSTARIFRGGQTAAGVIANSGASYATDALLSAANATDTLFGTKLISHIKYKAMYGTATMPKIRPVRGSRGKGFYVMLLHPWQIAAMKQETGEAGWAQIQANANVKGEENPLFTGALGMWDGVLLFEYDRVLTRTGAGGTTPAEGFTLAADKATTTDAVANGKTVARSLFLGAQAGVLAWGQLPKWYEDVVDCRKPQVVTDVIYGVSKTRFNVWDNAAQTNTGQQDLGVIAVDTQVVIPGSIA